MLFDGRKRFEVYFNYNKNGNWYFDTLSEAKSFAKKFIDNKPTIYDLEKDDFVYNW